MNALPKLTELLSQYKHKNNRVEDRYLYAELFQHIDFVGDESFRRAPEGFGHISDFWLDVPPL